MTTRSDRYNLMQLRALAIQDAMDMSAEEMNVEDVADGVDGAKEAELLRRSMRETAARALREAKPVRDPQYIPLSARPRKRPSIDVLKTLVKDVFARDPALGLAFREGKRQADDDWMSLYDDLVDLGAITPNEDAD